MSLLSMYWMFIILGEGKVRVYKITDTNFFYKGSPDILEKIVGLECLDHSWHSCDQIQTENNPEL